MELWIITFKTLKNEGNDTKQPVFYFAFAICIFWRLQDFESTSCRRIPISYLEINILSAGLKNPLVKGNEDAGDILENFAYLKFTWNPYTKQQGLMDTCYCSGAPNDCFL